MIILKGLKTLITIIAAAAVSFFVSAITVDYRGDTDNIKTENVNLTATAEMEEIPGIAEKIMPSVVGIMAQLSGKETSMGSGFAVTGNGYIMTNNHVIYGAKKITVTLENGKTLPAQKIWSDSRLDLALIRVAQNLQPIAIGDSSLCKVGEEVIAIGNPLSMQFQHTVTSGIISAKDRTIEMSGYYMENLLQTDASINPGNSGGPLVNSKGEVIGINTIKVTSAEGIGFAIPVNICKPIIESAESTGTFETPYLGLYAYDRATAVKILGEYTEEAGIYVAQVEVGSPASSSGIKKGDIITAIDGYEINSMLDLRERIFYHKPGERVNVDVLRDGRKNTMTVVLTKNKGI